ncbi:MAG: InlB B-repeat-containing protein [Bacilli bacterium]|jgi:uncharacterized repeat protein (TIGR02543 family)|nr:InlB B-repeat-containing protein [Bacilli bacterium]HHU24987.1 InlB B-repeat-containing protein [Acholeplasmataceae bacterium]
MKKFLGLLLLVSFFVLVGCDPTSTKVRVYYNLNYDGAPTAETVQIEKGSTVTQPTDPTREGFIFIGWFTDVAGNEPFTFDTAVDKNLVLYAKWEEPDLTPVLNRTLYHWVPKAIDANVTAELDIKTADETTITVKLNNAELEEFIDYEYVEGVLTIFGTYLSEAELGLGTHTFEVSTEFGETEFTIEIVANASLGSSIPKEIVKGLDMTQIPSYLPTEVIEGAPDLMITEVSVDMGLYTYVEVFNNTNAPYNLKNHRLVFSNLALQTKLESKGLFEQPLGMGSSAFIYQDYIIQPLSSAVIWLVSSFPWSQTSGNVEIVDGTQGRAIIEAENVQANIFGDKPENLSIAKFRDVYGLAENVLVFPIRPQPCLVNATSAGNAEGLGAAPIKSGGSSFTGVNSSIVDRGFQIQKFDLDMKIPVADMEGVSYYKYDLNVLNREEDLYVDGVLDKTKMQIFGGRETVNALYARIVYYNENDEIVGYASGGKAIDMYNANNANYLKMYDEVVTPISTALIYANYVDGERVKWGAMRSLEYTIPEAGSTLMRYIPLAGMTEIYQEKLASEHPLKLMGLAPEVPEISNNVDIEVPISNAYPKDYLTQGYNTVGRLIMHNFTKKE